MSLLSHFKFKGNQEKAVTDPAPAIAVTAGAGSGKTLSLVGRYLHLLEQGYPIRSLLAITFTEKAAREMRSKIRDPFSRIQPAAFDLQLPNLDSAGLLAGKRAVVPSDPVLARYAELEKAHYGKLYSGEPRNLAAFRDTLLPKLLSGEIRVPEAQGMVEEAVG